MRMEELKKDTFQPGNLTLAQLRNLSPSDLDWRGADFLALNSGWRFEEGKKQLVIVCARSRVRENERVHCAGYSNGEIGWPQ